MGEICSVYDELVELEDSDKLSDEFTFKYCDPTNMEYGLGLCKFAPCRFLLGMGERRPLMVSIAVTQYS